MAWILAAPPPLDIPVDINTLIFAFVLVIWVLSVVVQAIRSVASQARRRFQELQEGRQAPRPSTFARPAPPAPGPTPAAAETPQRDLMSDLERVLREQLGLDIPPSRPAEPAQPTSAPPPTVAPVPEAPRRRPARPTRPARAAARVQPPVPAAPPPTEHAVESQQAPREPAAPRQAREVHHETAYLERVRTAAARSELRRLLSGPNRRQAILLHEVIGPPCALRPPGALPWE